MDEQMIADLFAEKLCEWSALGKMDDPTEVAKVAAREAAHSVIAGKVAELTEALEGREAAMRWVYENGMVPDPVRPKWVSEQFSDAYADNRAALAPYPERRSEHHE